MIRTVGVVVPAANEQATIGACLDSLRIARNQLRRVAVHDVNVRIVVVLDRCIDGTEAIVRRHRGVDPVVSSAGQAGAARATGARWLLTNLDTTPSELWIANTDADSTVPHDWLTAQLTEAKRGIHIVVGTVLPGAGLPPAAERMWFARHVLHEGHPHVHGANLGIRGDVYASLGGWPALETGEDVTLVQRAASAGHLRIARTAGIPVRTSSRLIARAPRGFAEYMRTLRASPSEVVV